MRIKQLCYIWIMMLLSVTTTYGQDSVHYVVPKSTKKSAIQRLSKSLEEKAPDKEIADEYMALAKELSQQGEYSKAESYITQAIGLYSKTRNKELQSGAFRELARTQEAQGKFDQAITSYNKAANTTSQKKTKTLNTNDVKRLEERANPKSQSPYILDNINLSKSTKDKRETAMAHQQMAQNKLDLDDKKGAVYELESALESVTDDPEETSKIKQVIAQAYMSEQQYDEAIEISESLVTEAKESDNTQQEVKQLQHLARTYIETRDEKKGIETLQEAYQIALQNHHTAEAKSTLTELVEYYKGVNNTQLVIQMYSDFVQQLDTLIKADSTLIDEKFFQLHEERIQRLENERALKDELIARTNRFNYVLLGAIVLILIFLGFIAKALYSIQKKNKKIALQSLRREMNPHFIFNSLNSVNQFIAQNNELEANKYLSSYSRLMRNIMENSNKDFITLTTEVEQLKEYLELENMRFRDKFTYDIYIDDTLDTDAIYVPNMIIQPQLENAIWHGLRYIESDGRLTLHIEKQNDSIRILIEDNGIGIKRSQELKTKHQKQHNSRGLSNTSERIRLLNKLYNIHISMHIAEKEATQGSGVIVAIHFPFIDKKP